jgi:ribonuclease HI
MQQLFLFTPQSSENKNILSPKHHWKLFIDGASRNNPGPSGAGIYLLKDDELILQKGFFLGSKTNNQAEYLALLLGVFYLEKNVMPHDTIQIISDSQLLIRQLQGIYKVRNEVIKALYFLATTMTKDMKCTFLHVLREENSNADKMANVGIDKKVALPAEFIQLLSQYDIGL